VRIEEVSLTEGLDLGDREIISIIGGGGKTTLANCLSKTLNSEGKAVISTTTTRILPPQMGEGEVLIYTTEPSWLNKIDFFLRDNKLIHLGVEVLPQGKIKGLTVKLCKDVILKTNVDYLVIEADGAQGKSIKAHSDCEPVVPDFTTLFIAVIGIDCLGQRVMDSSCHRAKLFCSMLDVSPGDPIDEDLILALFSHPEGYFKTLPPKARAFIFMNKVHSVKDFQVSASPGEKLLSLKRVEGILVGHFRGPGDKFILLSRETTRSGNKLRLYEY
jgi:probable selenium-dependent hydroxylase accessory protein YqeC